MDALQHEMEKLLRAESQRHKKEKAVLDQRLELMSMQLAEVQERELQQKQLHETMMSALKAKADDPEASHIKQLRDQYEDQIRRIKEDLEAQVKELHDRNIALQSVVEEKSNQLQNTSMTDYTQTQNVLKDEILRLKDAEVKAKEL